jgi:hypothetical protein
VLSAAGVSDNTASLPDGIKQGKIFSVFHKYQHTFPEETSFIFGSSGLSPSIR